MTDQQSISEPKVHIKPELKVQSSLFNNEHMVHSTNTNEEFTARLRKALSGSSLNGHGAGARLSEITGVTPKAASKWLNAESMPGRGNLKKIANALNVREEWLQYGTGAINDTIANTSIAPDTKGLVPVISWVQAGAWHEAQDLFVTGDGEEFLPCPVPHGLNTFALRVEGDSMTAPSGLSYPEGSIIYVDPDRRGGVVSGNDIIAKLVGLDAVTFKRLAKDGSTTYLKPLNPNHRPIFDEFRVLGQVIGMWFDTR